LDSSLQISFFGVRWRPGKTGGSQQLKDALSDEKLQAQRIYHRNTEVHRVLIPVGNL